MSTPHTLNPAAMQLHNDPLPIPKRKLRIGLAVMETIFLLISGVLWICGSLALWILTDKNYVHAFLYFLNAMNKAPRFSNESVQAFFRLPYAQFEQGIGVAMILMALAVLLLLVLLIVKGTKSFFGGAGLFSLSFVMLLFGFVFTTVYFNSVSALIASYQRDRLAFRAASQLTVKQETLYEIEHLTAMFCGRYAATMFAMALFAFVAGIVLSVVKKKKAKMQWLNTMAALKTDYFTRRQHCAAQLRALQANPAIDPGLPVENPVAIKTPGASYLAFLFFILAWVAETVGGLLLLCARLWELSDTLWNTGHMLVYAAFALLLLVGVIAVVQAVVASHRWKTLEEAYRSSNALLMQQFMQKKAQLQAQSVPQTPVYAAQPVFSPQVGESTQTAAASAQQSAFVPPATDQTQTVAAFAQRPLRDAPTVRASNDLPTQAQLVLYCPRCGTANSPGTAFCSRCGLQLPKN